MSAQAVTLEDKFTRVSGRVYLTGTQALIRLLLEQRARDCAQGLKTAGFVSGYRGSPLGGFDQALWRARSHLAESHVHFVPGVNEELAATAVWGSQQAGLFPGARYDGVFALWYGKGPGVDRCGDVFKHANAAGTARHGGVLLVAGDDHACKSSTLPHQSEHAFDAAMIPVLYPTGVREIVPLGLHGFAMSRWSGCYVALKTVSEIVDASGTVDLAEGEPRIVIPEDFPVPPGGMNIRWPDAPLEQERRLQHDKVYAALAYARANRLNRVTIDSPRPRLGIIASGKSYLDVLQALDDLGIDSAVAAQIGLRVFKVAMPWPLEPQGVREFAQGLDEVLVVEEKRQLIEYQLKEQLYNWPDSMRPRVVGKYDEHGEWEAARSDWLLPAAGEHTPAMVARAIAARVERFFTSPLIQARLRFLEDKEAALARPRSKVARIPYFCSGCPHNTSTRVPEGSKALAGIGCHYMATWIRAPETMTFTQMGGEGAPWIGIQPFTETRHVFANLGDGTYFHSGILAIRAAVAAKVNITYKLLFNDAVAMTGGQPVDGTLTVPMLVRQMQAEGVHEVVVVSDEPGKYRGESSLGAGVAAHHRDELDCVQRRLREVPGVTVLVYDQTCAAEKRRRRKRGLMADPPVRVVINDAVCEGCGDCGVKSNCLSVVPLETEFGRKRAIDQSSCNKDMSCLKGLCPSFVTVEGGQPRRRKAAAGMQWPALPEPALPLLEQPWGILVTGVGGTGVVTIGALLGMAAHIEGKGATVLDITGLAQKGGAVYSHVRLASSPAHLHAVRIGVGEARTVIACDLVVAASDEALIRMRAGQTRALVNGDVSPTGEFTRNADFRAPADAMAASIAEACGPDAAAFVNATSLSERLLGTAIGANLFMVGFAWQRGLIPLARQSILAAVALNDTAVEANRAAFEWGRRAAVDPEAVQRAAAPAEAVPESLRVSATLDEAIERRVAFLQQYQDASYAERYRQRVAAVRDRERAVSPGSEALSQAVARSLFKLMAMKDEYEVARLHTNGDFRRRLESEFEGNFRLRYHLAPPLLARVDPATGEPRKQAYGEWIQGAMGLLARLRFLRGTAFDPFSYTEERRAERRLLRDYEALVDELTEGLDCSRLAIAVSLASIPEKIRGFGPVRARAMEAVRGETDALLAQWRSGSPSPVSAAAPERAAA